MRQERVQVGLGDSRGGHSTPSLVSLFSALPPAYKVLPHAGVELPEFQKERAVGLVSCPCPVTLGRNKVMPWGDGEHGL